MSRLLSIVLSPLSLFYRAVTDLRNHLYDIRSKKIIDFTPFIISVGNLSVGGTGKTPMVLYLAKWLLQHHSLAILSRGYGRQTRGVRIANEHDTARTLGDEPYLFYRKVGQQATVAVGEERVAAVPEMLFHAPDIRLILLDDAYQHRAIGRDFSILLTSYQRPFYKDYVLPAGRLRESRRGARRADAVVVTKCPDGLAEGEQEPIKERIKAYATSDTPVFFTGLRYGAPQPASSANDLDASLDNPRPVILFSGLADASLFDTYARQHFAVAGHITFGDHHRYTPQDHRQLADALAKAGPSAVLLTTEKDVVKFESITLPLFYLPVQPYFLSAEDQFQALIAQRLRDYAGA